MPAALYMALTRSLLLAESRRDPSPCAVLANVNRLLLELGEPNMFVTIFYGIVDGADRHMIYARAGHDFPLLLRKGAVQPLRGEGACLGILDPAELQLGEEQLTLAPGDRLVLYTDGLKDVMSPDGQLSDRARLESLLRANASLGPRELCAAVFDGLSAYQGGAEQYDDMTLLIVGVE
jgi:sigma-B regulation protein RsbU (phosphoserine phosphatase)